MGFVDCSLPGVLRRGEKRWRGGKVVDVEIMLGELERFTIPFEFLR